MKTMTVSEARKLFASALESVVADDEPLIIVRYRRPIAAIVPIDDRLRQRLRLPSSERAAAKRDPRSDRYSRRR